MIHTDGRPTIAMRGSLPEERSSRVENLARDLAAVWGVTVEEARAAITAPAPAWAELLADDPALD